MRVYGHALVAWVALGHVRSPEGVLRGRAIPDAKETKEKHRNWPQKSLPGGGPQQCEPTHSRLATAAWPPNYVPRESKWRNIKSSRGNAGDLAEKGCKDVAKNALTTFWVGKFWGFFWLADMSKKNRKSTWSRINSWGSKQHPLHFVASIPLQLLQHTHTHIHLEIKRICSNFGGGAIFEHRPKKLPKNFLEVKVSTKTHTHTHTHLDKTNSTFCARFMIMNVPCKIETTAFQGQKRKVTTTLFHHHGHVLQVHEGDEDSPPVTSFVRQGHHWRPCPPAAKKRTSFTSFEKVHTHTQPTKTRAGYACATQHDMTWTRGTLKWDQPPKSTKTGQRRKETQQGPQTTVQQQQAEPQHNHQPTHTPNKSTGKQQDTRTPASKARPTDRRGTAAKQGPTDRPARFVYVSMVKKENQIQQKHHGTVSLSWTCAGWQKGSKPCSIQVRLVTAVRLTSNWCTTVPYQKPKRSSQACKPDTFTTLSVAYDMHGVIGQLEVRMFQHFTTFDTIHLNRIQEGRTQREEREEAIELIQPASIWEVRECTSEMANRMAGPYGDYLDEFPR